MPAPPATALPPHEWRRRQAAHEARVDALTGGHLTRAARGETHPVEDFLFRYYRLRPAALRRWHPGPGVVLIGDTGWRATARHYLSDGDGVRLDTGSFLAARGAHVERARAVLAATAARPAFHGCFGLHEWAMVYRQQPDERRHAAWPLRLSPTETDHVVESSTIRCSHVDAYRFFTPAARDRNTLRPTRDTQTDHEQPGCIHATMDLYKYAYTLLPAIPSELVADAFDLARDARHLDMRAAPYDLSGLGMEPIPIETATGRATYVAEQRRLTAAGTALRSRLLAACEALTVHA